MIGQTRYVAQAEIARQSQLSAEMAKLQQSVSTGKRLSIASDDPAAAGRASEIRQTQSDQATWTRNVTTGAAIASAADDKMDSVQSALDRAKELILAGRNDSTAAADRVAIATELRGLASDIATYSQATDPTGRELFPTGTPLAIPVSDAISITATDTRANVFDSVATSAGTQTIVDILNAAATALTISDGAQRGTAATVSVGDIQAALAHITALRADQGLRGQRFDDAAARLATSGDGLSSERNDLEATDMTYALAQYSLKDTALKAAQAVFARAHDKSLFDLLG